MTDLRFNTVQLATGPRLHCAGQGEVGGEPVVLLHGWPDSWFSFSRVLPHLLPRYRALIPDQRGFGDSEKPENGYGIDDFVADAIALLDELRINRAAFIGHSFGSFVARAVAIRNPDRVSRLALIGTGVLAGTPPILEARAVLNDLPDPVPPEFAREFQASTAYLPLPEAFFERIVTESLKLPSPLWRRVLDGLLAYDDGASLSRITAPTLLIWGDHDSLFPQVDQDRLVATIPGARLVTLRETGHCPNWERPDRLAMHLQAFLDEGNRQAGSS